jgi:serine protease Do
MMSTRLRGAFPAGALSTELADLAARVRAAVVQVSDGRGIGAGTIWSEDGLIVTNHHVVQGRSARVAFEDDSTHDASVVASLPERDLAILRVDATGLPALAAGDSSALRPGEIVIAVGHPNGDPGAVTFGVFSGVGPYEGGRGRHFRESLLANLELRPGNSGGPLVNARAEVVGINAMVMGPGTALAIPTATVEALLTVRERRSLGVRITALPPAAAVVPEEAGHRDLLLMIVDVKPGSVADRAGLVPGDILLSIAGQRLDEPADIAWALTSANPREAVEIAVLRAGRTATVTARMNVSG